MSGFYCGVFRSLSVLVFGLNFVENVNFFIRFGKISMLLPFYMRRTPTDDMLAALLSDS